MKKAVLYLLFFTYGLAIAKPLLPFVTDAVAHAFFYQKHIATVHWKNGKSHVHQEFVKDAKKETKNSSTSKKLIQPDEYTINNPGHYISHTIHQPHNTSVAGLLTHAGYFNCFLPPPDLNVV